jgi:hypothetical protein
MTEIPLSENTHTTGGDTQGTAFMQHIISFIYFIGTYNSVCCVRFKAHIESAPSDQWITPPRAHMVFTCATRSLLLFHCYSFALTLFQLNCAFSVEAVEKAPALCRRGTRNSTSPNVPCPGGARLDTRNGSAARGMGRTDACIDPRPRTVLPATLAPVHVLLRQ